jgi:predicted dehydrogenase
MGIPEKHWGKAIKASWRSSEVARPDHSPRRSKKNPLDYSRAARYLDGCLVQETRLSERIFEPELPKDSMKSNSQISRRRFLQRAAAVTGAAAGAQFIGMPSLLAAASPNGKLGVAVVGAGGMGGYSWGCALNERLVAFCDVDDKTTGERLKEFGQKFPDQTPPKAFYDYRKMLEECQKDIDVVLIATPDHNHAPAAIRSIDLGKATFSQKPLAHDIYECYALAKAAREKNVPTQMGNQGHCSETIRKACEYIWAGAIGNVTETHSLLGRNFGGHGQRPPSKPVPPGLHWDEWIGPAPFRPYHEGLHPFSWRNWRAFGTGTIGDMACHNLDALFWALRIGEAKHFTVECLHTVGGNEEMYPQSNIVRYEVPARGDMGPVKVHVYDNAELRPEIMKDAERQYQVKFEEDTLFVGDKGLFRTRGTCESLGFLPEDRRTEIPVPPRTLPRAHGGGPIEDLFYACKHGTVPCSNFPGASAPLTAFALTGHLAQFAGVGKKLEWDVEAMRCTNVPEVNGYLRRQYRPGWEV